MLATAATVLALAGAGDLADSRHLWATINVCDTPANPNTLGLRASMPGTGRRTQTMWMRFRVQYRARGERTAWRSLADADSGYVRIGHAAIKARQSGWSGPFALRPGARYRGRGVGAFQGRRGTRVAARATETTTPDHHVSVADPDGYSEASCVVAG